MTRFKTISSIFCILILNGCLSIAKLENFPKSNNSIDFNNYATINNSEKEPFWTSKTSNEYYLTTKLRDENKLEEIIKISLLTNGYRLIHVDTLQNSIIGKRGLRANEWNCIAGVYYQLVDSAEIYIKCEITQDITGGWSENRAKKIGLVIDNMCKSEK